MLFPRKLPTQEVYGVWTRTRHKTSWRVIGEIPRKIQKIFKRERMSEKIRKYPILTVIAIITFTSGMLKYGGDFYNRLVQTEQRSIEHEEKWKEQSGVNTKVITLLTEIKTEMRLMRRYHPIEK